MLVIVNLNNLLQSHAFVPSAYAHSNTITDRISMINSQRHFHGRRAFNPTTNNQPEVRWPSASSLFGYLTTSSTHYSVCESSGKQLITREDNTPLPMHSSTRDHSGRKVHFLLLTLPSFLFHQYCLCLEKIPVNPRLIIWLGGFSFSLFYSSHRCALQCFVKNRFLRGNQIWLAQLLNVARLWNKENQALIIFRPILTISSFILYFFLFQTFLEWNFIENWSFKWNVLFEIGQKPSSLYKNGKKFLYGLNLCIIQRYTFFAHKEM